MALTADKEAVCRFVYADALKVEVFNGGVGVFAYDVAHAREIIPLGIFDHINVLPFSGRRLGGAGINVFVGIFALIIAYDEGLEEIRGGVGLPFGHFNVADIPFDNIFFASEEVEVGDFRKIVFQFVAPFVVGGAFASNEFNIDAFVLVIERNGGSKGETSEGVGRRG